MELSWVVEVEALSVKLSLGVRNSYVETSEKRSSSKEVD